MEPVPRSTPDILSFANQRMTDRVRPVPKLFAVLVIVVSCLALVGWQFNITALKSVSADFISIKPNTALSLILAALSLLMIQSSVPRHFTYRLSKTLSIIVILLSGATLLEYLTGWNPGLDALLFKEAPGAFETLMPGRMEPITAGNLILLGLALFSITPKKFKQHPLSHLLAFPIALVSLLPLIAYLYGARFEVGIGAFSAMAPQTAFCFLLMACAISLTHLNHDLAAVLVSDGPGGSMSRRILPAAILIPLLFGWLRVFGERAGWISTEYGTALFTTANIAGFLLVVWIQSVAMQRNEIRRRSLQQKHDALRIQGELRDQFVAMLSHDLRNPITAASSCAQLIRRNPTKIEFTTANAEKIIESLARGDRMIQDMLEVTRIRAGHPMQIAVIDCDISAIARSTAHEFAMLHGDRFQFDGEKEIIGQWDPIAIRRGMENLCNNALKYGAPESPILIRAEHAGDRIQLSVLNQGAAISSEDQKTLFEPFQRASTAMNKGKKGWGLGLALVRGIAEAHGGRVFVESSPEKGTRFTIELPGRHEQAIPRRTAS